MAIKTNTELVNTLLNIYNKYSTYYAKGTFGRRATNSVIDGVARQYPSYYTASRVSKLKSLNDNTVLFDCCGLIKGAFWGYPENGVYASNGVPDKNDQGLWDACKDKNTTTWNNLIPGELLWMKGHVGIYIGDGKGIECTTNWKSNVQITAVANIGPIAGLNSRKWTGHGKLPYITYGAAQPAAPTTPATAPKTTTYTHKDFVKEVQTAIGAGVDGVAGPETLSKTVTVSKCFNAKHKVVKPIQKYLNSIGFDCGTVDGVAGPKFDAAVKKFQKANGCVCDGEITAKQTTWKKLLKLC